MSKCTARTLLHKSDFSIMNIMEIHLRTSMVPPDFSNIHMTNMEEVFLHNCIPEKTVNNHSNASRKIQNRGYEKP